ncbi:MAG: PilZ domain-containing protein [Desulfomonile tiedjei]|uniref:PilZ domain-containing protein n=1 Tax=Desulfomonile tiedjei TaxID=2358 RepID=A0A9D6UZK4_9BACT|nr:PilZ domain-containing protein [Desulfomonile tiedjei]
MKKPVISAKKVLDDISQGLDDADLMRKYNLSAKGLRSLFNKLAAAGLLKQVNARELVEDIRAGTNIADILSKYGLTDKAYSSLIDTLDRTGLLNGEAQQANHSKNTIRMSNLVDDIRSGMSKPDLLAKYKLSSRGLRWVSMMLVSSGAMSWKEIFDKLCTNFSELVPDKPRNSKRYRLPFELPVYDSVRPDRIGTVRDVSENGVGVRGIMAEEGETKTLVIGGDEFGELASFSFQGVCKWASKDSSGQHFSGFEISDISMGSLSEFQLLMQLVSIRYASANAGSIK